MWNKSSEELQMLDKREILTPNISEGQEWYAEFYERRSKHSIIQCKDKRGVRDSTFKQWKEVLAFAILIYDDYLPCEEKTKN